MESGSYLFTLLISSSRERYTAATKKKLSKKSTGRGKEEIRNQHKSLLNKVAGGEREN
jgi:hypothetical protein